VSLGVPPGGELIANLKRSDVFRSLDGTARVRLESDGKSYTVTQLLLAEKPDRLRLDLLSPFGQPLLQLATDGRQLTALLPPDAVFYLGEASDRNLQRFTRLPLQLPDLIALILYQVPLIAYDDESVTPLGNGLVLELSGREGLRQVLRFDHERRLVEASYYCAEELQLRLLYDDFDDGPPPFPRAIRFEMPAQKSSASLRFSELILNPELPEGRFRLNPPVGFEVKELP